MNPEEYNLDKLLKTIHVGHNRLILGMSEKNGKGGITTATGANILINSANPVKIGGGIDREIYNKLFNVKTYFMKGDTAEQKKERDTIGPLKEAQVVSRPAHKMKNFKRVFHVCAPNYNDYDLVDYPHGDDKLVETCINIVKEASNVEHPVIMSCLLSAKAFRGQHTHTEVCELNIVGFIQGLMKASTSYPDTTFVVFLVGFMHEDEIGLVEAYKRIKKRFSLDDTNKIM